MAKVEDWSTEVAKIEAAYEGKVVGEEKIGEGVTIYILELEDGRWYVGRSSLPRERILAHFSNAGAAWTKKYKPIRVHAVHAGQSVFDEDKYTKECMSQYGIENVRGGRYVSDELTPQQVRTIQQEIWAAKDLCTHCGGQHYVVTCPSKKTYPKCKHCGRENHSSRSCFATTHINGDPVTRKSKRKPRRY